MQCIFCDIVNDVKPSLKVWEDDNFLVILDIRPINPGHLLVIPKQHFDDVFELPDPLYNGLFQVAKKIAPILKEATSAARVGMAVEGFGVPHVHLHIVPVNSGNELNPEKTKELPETELVEMQRKIVLSVMNTKL